MTVLQECFLSVILFFSFLQLCESAKINTPRVLLPWFDDLHVNFTFEIIEGGCYSWSLSRDDIIDLEPLYEETWGHCSRAARVSVSKTCVPPGSVIILADEINTGEILRGDVDIDKISDLKVTSTTWKLFLEEAPEAFEVVAYDDQGNKFSTLEGLHFKWTVENLGNSIGEDPLVTLVNWRDTDYEAPRGVTEVEASGSRASAVLLYGQGMGDARVTVCLGRVCTEFTLQVVASVVLTPATATVAPGDTLRYRVVRARAGRLTVQDVADTLYHMKVSDNAIANLDDSVSLVRGRHIGTTTVLLMSGVTDVATAVLNIAEPHSIRVSLRPSRLLFRDEPFVIHCVVYDADGHALTAGDETLIRLSVEAPEADVDLLSSTENGTLTDAVARRAGGVRISARLYSVAGKVLTRKVEGGVSGIVVEPLEVVPPHLFVAWTDTVQEITLQHRGGGDEPVVWSESETNSGQNGLSLSPAGVATVRGPGELGVRVQMQKYSYVKAFGRVHSAVPELIQVSSSGQARVGRPHHLHVALIATYPETGDYYNFHRCNCDSFVVSLLEGPELHNVTAAPWVEPVEGACCVLQASWESRGVCSLRVSLGRAGDTARVAVLAAPTLVWPQHGAAAVVGAQLPVLAQGEALEPSSSDARTVAVSHRSDVPPRRHPDVQLFTIKCRRKGDARLALISHAEDERESVEFEASCAPHVSRIRLEPSETPGNCSGGPRIWLSPGQEAKIRVTQLDAIGRELLDERGPKATWETSPKHAGIEYRAVDRLFVETYPEYEPVPVPFKFYQTVIADEQAIGWTGTLKVDIPEATASIQAKVVAPIQCIPAQAHIAWEGDTMYDIATVTGGSGRYTVDSPKGVVATVTAAEGRTRLQATLPAAGPYDLCVSDACRDDRRCVEVHVEEVISVEVAAPRAVAVGSCVSIAAIARGFAGHRLSSLGATEWRVSGGASVREGELCGESGGPALLAAKLAGVWSNEHHVLVFPGLSITPSKSVLPVGGRVQLRQYGGPPAHLATFHYDVITAVDNVEVTSEGLVHGLIVGSSKIRLTAQDFSNAEMATAEAEVQVVPISSLRIRTATQTLLIGSPTPLWVEASGGGGVALPPAALSGLQPAPSVVWTARDPTTARLYTSHVDDLLDRSIAEGLAVRVVPLKAGVITIDVRARNMGQFSESRTWDSTLEILAISDILTNIEGSPAIIDTGSRIALAVGSTVRLRSFPRSDWSSYGDAGVLNVSSAGELRALSPGFGVVIARHSDDRNKIYRETMMHVEVSLPHYCTVQPSSDDDDSALRLVLRNSVGRVLIAPEADVTAEPALIVQSRKSAQSALGNELLVKDMDPAGAYMTVQATVNGVTVKDEVKVTASDSHTKRIFASGGSVICLEGVGWRAPPSVHLYESSGGTLAVLAKDVAAKHFLKADRPTRHVTIHQLPIDKIEFLPGDWQASMVPLSISSQGVSGPSVLCPEETRLSGEHVTVELPHTCIVPHPYVATAVYVTEGQIGCSITTPSSLTEPKDVELCAELNTMRACTKVLLLPPIAVSTNKLSVLKPPAEFTVTGHPKALRLVKFTTSPGLRIENTYGHGEIRVTVRTDPLICGTGWVNVMSRLTDQDLRVEVDRECDLSCGTLLEALFALLRPYWTTLITLAALAGAYFYVKTKIPHRSAMQMPSKLPQSVLPPRDRSPNLSLDRSRTWSRSPYASRGPAAPVYGDASVLPDASFSPTTSTNSRFL